MQAKQQILSKLKRQLLDKVSLPSTENEDWIRYADPVEQFSQMVQLVGGSCRLVDSTRDVLPQLQQFEQWNTAKRVLSNLADVPGNVDLTEVSDPHDLDNLDFVVYPGEFAVAENGAVWLTDRDLRHRVVFFITQYLVLVIPRQQIVHNMHEAYARAQPPQPGFGLFLSGPSKTADIEQSLVIGAHGCRELQVFLV